MNIILFDDPVIRKSLLPLTFTRPVAEIRVGILTIAEKWSKRLEKNISFNTEDYLCEKYPCIKKNVNLWINGAFCPTDDLIDAIDDLNSEEALVRGTTIVAAKTQGDFSNLQQLPQQKYDGHATVIDAPWKIFKKNAEQIQADFDLITLGRISEDIEDAHTVIYGAENVFVEEGATIRAAIINAENGPVYIGKNAVISEGAIIRGAFALCEGAHVNMGAKVRGDSTIGPFCKVGGELSNSVLFGYSNKGHDGFVGNSVIGEWCNLGADTNTSNLKNNYANVKVWDYGKGGFTDTGEMFCGLIMGDHSKCSINTMFNTGTVVGVSSNIFGAGFPRNFIPSFSWGGAAGLTTYQLNKANEVIARVMERRGLIYDAAEQEIMKNIFEQTAEYRIWENQ
ncbi:Glucose-1-phosphate thymidylyltransferase [Fulvivirga imtechensis AK7]|uniref:Glucose-1-phosphate thymidylyltransferase n=1 Tax=Fulvivirga imtechensis AK7 TaxID=1237149 RepID=L8JMY6_9BACT|nr:GlmU family protein [Fulvivirga imtechensis]ELR70276.1 Glucose-1-phosphate thymidylyltransferase [Fulvivirga imtechensis AK7]